MPSLRTPPIAFAHRGGRAHGADNALDTFALALDMGATGLETDVWLSQDGHPMLDHDGVAWHRGVRRAFSSLQRERIGDDIPTLADMYQTCGTDFELSVDLKDPTAADAVISAARAAGAEDRLWLCHGDWDLRLTANWSEWRPENAAFGKNLFTVAGPGEDDFSAYDEAAAARASGYIRARADSDHPWAMLVGFITPHFPFVVRRPYWDKYYPKHADQPEIPAHFESMHPHNRRMAEWFSYIGVDPDLTARSRRLLRTDRLLRRPSRAGA